MPTTTRSPWRALALGLALTAALGAQAAGTVGTTLPTTSAAAVEDTSLGAPVIGFGATGKAVRTPVIFLHGNGGTPFDTGCSTHVAPNMRPMAQFFADSGYNTSELWGLGWQGTQCDLMSAPANMASLGHTVTANVAELRQFVRMVLASTGARRVDIVAHGSGAVLAREWVRQDFALRTVRRLVSIDGSHGGTLMCSASSTNYWQLGFVGGFTANSPFCQELGSPNTPFLKLLNRTRVRVAASSTLVIRNGDASFPYLPVADGYMQPVPSVDAYGQAMDFSGSPKIAGAAEVVLTGQGAYDPLGGVAHVGIAYSPATWKAAFDFLSK